MFDIYSISLFIAVRSERNVRWVIFECCQTFGQSHAALMFLLEGSNKTESVHKTRLLGVSHFRTLSIDSN